MNGELGRVQQDIRAARGALRRANRAVTQLEQSTGVELGRYEMSLNEPLNTGEFIQFLRLAITGATSSIVIVVSQPPAGPDNPETGEPDGEDVQCARDR